MEISGVGMGDRHDYVALEWVKGEIAETLKQAGYALEAYVDNPADEAQLLFCLSYIHQVHGTLQMVEFFAAALLAEEMEQLVQALLDDQLSNRDEAFEVLMQAILQLPVYLDRIQSARRDLPMAVLPLLNDLRATRGEPLLTESTLFTPKLPPSNPPLSERRIAQLSVPELTVLLKRLRHMLQVSLLGVLRGEDLTRNLAHMSIVFSRLENLSQAAPLEPLWQVAAGLVDGLSNGSVKLGAAVRMLLSQVERELRRLVEDQALALNQPAADELINNLLFYVAHAEADSPRLAALHATYGLAQALASDADTEQLSHLSGPDDQAMRSVVVALCEELANIKDTLDIFVRGDRQQLASLAALQTPLKQVADTLALLGFAHPRSVILEQMQTLAALVSGQHDNLDPLLMDIAGGLLYTENTLTGMVSGREGLHNGQSLVPSTDLDQLQRKVLQESKTGLEQAKDGIIDFIASQWQHQHLEKVPHLLKQVRGALQMVHLPRAAALIERCQRYIEEQLLAQQIIPNWESLDTLADAITSVEYYLERLQDDHASQGESILDVAEESLKNLGYTAAQAADSSPDSSASSALPAHRETEQAQGFSAADAEQQQPAEAFDHGLGLVVEEPERLREAAVDLAQPFDQTVDVATGANRAAATDTPSATESAGDHRARADEITDSSAPIRVPVESIQPPPADEEPVDDELREIFVEEAEEVLATLNQYYPQWRAEQDNQAALTELRRAFHTLKGSGRMVRALVSAELAWAMENLLNRVLEGGLPVCAAMLQLSAEVIELFPELVAEYASQQQRQRDDVDQLAATAHALARQEPVPLFAAAIEETGAERLAAAELDSVLEKTAAQPQPALAADATAVLDPETAALAEESELNQAAESVAVAPNEPVESESSVAAIEPVDELAALVKPTEQQADSVAALDPVLLDIFKNEAALHLDTLSSFLRDAQQQPRAISDALQRALHTLKGSAFMAGITPIADIATVLEKMAKDYQANLLPVQGLEYPLLASAEQLLRAGVAQLDSTPLQSIAGAAPLLEQLNTQISQRLAQAGTDLAADPEGGHAPTDISTFLAEGVDVLLDMDAQLASWRQHPVQRAELAVIQAELSALADSAGHAELPQVQDLCSALQELYSAVNSGRLPTAEQFFSQAEQAHEALLGMLDQVAAGLQVEPRDDCVTALHALLADQQQVLAPADSADITEPELLLESEPEPEPESESELELEPELGLELDAALELAAEFPAEDQLGSAELALDLDLGLELPEESELPHEAELKPDLEEALKLDDSPSAYATLLLEEQDELAELDERDPELVEIFLDEGFEIIENASAALLRWMAEPNNVLELATLQRELHTLKGGARMVEIPEIGNLGHELEFLYEDLSADRLPATEALLELLHDCHDCLAVMLEAVRDSTTLPDAEPLIARIQATRAGETLPAAAITTAHAARQIAETTATTEHAKSAAEKTAAVEAPDLLPPSPATGLQQWSLPVTGALSKPVPAGLAQPAWPLLEQAQQAAEQHSAQRSPQEQVRVPAELLENLVNLAGETSIFRGRVEQQVSDFAFTLNEMDATIERLRDQLRRLDTETQAQILSRHQQDSERYDYADFDPLEMDRYSQLQQLSRALFESSSDLLDLKETMAARSRDAETLLLQQARVNTELQEGLMRTRMVPFERLLPRLRRLVRQMSSELGKKVELTIGNAEGEVDRSVLQRMLAPLEHMLRNAVDHGIETAQQRRAAGKPVTGTVHLELSREGSEIAILLSDDGAGIDLEGVRHKALELGLLDAQSELTDQEVMQLVLHAGFTTAEHVTQVSGRGVGMDVVNSSIKELGGSIRVESQPGQGSSFHIRLPFTVSVNRALMVMAGDDSYAVPLNSIEGIVRISPYELDDLYEHERRSGEPAHFEYAGERYALKYIGDLLSNRQQPKLVAQMLPLPVILVRSREFSVAVQVDALAGSREIVVKSLGPQFAKVHGISGATILGDGRVVVILDLLATIRWQQANQNLLAGTGQAQRAAAEADKAYKLVMVVDDSVTVRKVTARLLERQGMQVMTAKDGVEAIAQLQERKPDIMLLDIEMPRMDGFEVAQLVRNDAELKNLPIIMITSRAGEKHRERALAIGVNDYLSKPYQEQVLLDSINKLLSENL